MLVSVLLARIMSASDRAVVVLIVSAPRHRQTYEKLTPDVQFDERRVGDAQCGGDRAQVIRWRRQI